MQKAVLILEDGTTFYGHSAGKVGTTTGEICFNTGMTGYQEVFTDPSYFGQIMVTTNAHIGNYGTIDEDQQSDSVKIAGLVCKNFNENYSRPLADSSLQDYFEKNSIVGICDVDTRAIVRHIRDKGAMNAIISSEDVSEEKLRSQLSEVPSMDGLELASKVSRLKSTEHGDPNASIKIAVMDYGCKQNILDCFTERGCFVKVFPAKTSLEEVNAWSPDGYFISNGPGDPSSMDYAIDFVKAALETEKPLFGICLGHQLLALACDIPTYKMHNGHRGLNHPVHHVAKGGLCEVTSQNHGFGVNPDAVRASDKVEITHINLNDDTIEGIKVKGKPAFSVQYHPESSPGPHDSRYLFDDFVAMMKS